MERWAPNSGGCADITSVRSRAPQLRHRSDQYDRHLAQRRPLPAERHANAAMRKQPLAPLMRSNRMMPRQASIGRTYEPGGHRSSRTITRNARVVASHKEHAHTQAEQGGKWPRSLRVGAPAAKRNDVEIVPRRKQAAANAAARVATLSGNSKRRMERRGIFLWRAPALH